VSIRYPGARDWFSRAENPRLITRPHLARPVGPAYL